LDRGYVVIPDGGEGYDIPLAVFQDHTRALGWLHHLSRKVWFTTDHLRELLAVTGAPYLP
jgi:hypothetical protein